MVLFLVLCCLSFHYCYSIDDSEAKARPHDVYITLASTCIKNMEILLCMNVLHSICSILNVVVSTQFPSVIHSLHLLFIVRKLCVFETEVISELRHN